MPTRRIDFLEDAPYLAGVSTLGGELLEANTAMVKALGYPSKEELLAAGPASFYPRPQDRLPFLTKLIEAGQWMDVEVMWQRKDGSPLLLRTSGRFVEDGRDSRFEAIAHDVTGLSKRRQDEEQQRRAEAIERFSGILAHNLGNISTIVSLNAGLVQSDLGPEHQSASSVREIVRAVDRTLVLTDSLRSLSGTHVGLASDVDLDTLLTDLGPIIQSQLRRGVELDLRLGSPNAWVRIDRNQLTELILILATNASEAMAGGGSVEIETTLRRGAVDDRGSELVVFVRDEGVGMDAETLDRIFDPYFSTKPIEKGRGLSLALAQAIARQAGGSLSATSEVGRGTTVTLRLPTR